MMGWAGHVARMGKNMKAYGLLVGKPEGKGLLGRPRRRWVDNTETDIGDIECGGMHWIELAQDRDQWKYLVNAEMNLRVL
jgi:hypothetical protein